MSRSRLIRVFQKRSDSGVAEIVGAILLFAVLITLFTSFMVWYIPAQTASNETHYQLQTKSSLGSFVSSLHDGVPAAGSTVTESMPLGIAGVSIFSQAQDTEFSILPQANVFNSSLAINLSLNLVNTTGVHTIHYFNATYFVTGILATNGNTEYITSIDYVVEDGALFQNYGKGQPSDSLGPLPVGISRSGSNYNMNLQAFGLAGQSETYSSSQSQVVNFLVNTSQSQTYVNGSLTSIAGNQYTIDGIALNSLNYTINGSLVNAWDYGFFSQFNSTQTGYSSVIALQSWNFTGAPLAAIFSGTSISVTNSNTLQLASFSFEYLVIQGL